MFTATLKSLLSRKIRLLLSGLAVVLGVMAVSAALVLSHTLSNGFDQLFRTVTENLDVQITGQENISGSEFGEPVSQPVPDTLVSQAAAVPGVAKATGSVSEDGARVVGPDGKVITSNGPPRIGGSWDPDDELIELRSGRGPAAPDEVAINLGLANKGNFSVGDTITVLTLQPAKEFTLVGIFGFTGDRESLGGETTVAFTDPVAQELMLGSTGVFTSIDIEADGGISQEHLRDEVKKAINGSYVVRTGEQVADDEASDVQQFLDVIRNILLGFAGVALFVGTFLILNTFSILIAQRTQELALLRSLGASRGQVIRSVLIEAGLIGLIASILGFVAGIGVAVLLRAFFESQGDADFPGPAVALPVSAVIASFAVGILITVIAALLPALRASRVPPIAAMRESATADKPLTKLTIAGAICTVVGVAGVGYSLFTNSDSTFVLWMLLVGVLLSFIGIALLTPAISRPVVSALGRAFSWSVPGKLGRRNSARNPRRTAITAGALMVGIALVTGVSILASSLNASINDIIKRDLNAELIITGDISGAPSTLPNYDPGVINEVRNIPGVQRATAIYLDVVGEDNSTTFASGGDLPDATSIFNLTRESGELRSLASGEVAISDDFARDRDLMSGDTVRVATQRGGDQPYRIVGIYDQSDVLNTPLFFSTEDATSRFRTSQATFGYIQLAHGANMSAVREQVDDLLTTNPEVSVQDQSGFINQQTEQVDTFLLMLYVLLGLAIIIAILGIVNTLALSILERTRELGLVRAVGMGRAQVVRMVTVESVVISLFGALLGVVVGSLLGSGVVRALRDDGVSELAFPWVSLIVFLLLAVIVGLFAAIVPALRASRINVLRAIAYE